MKSIEEDGYKSFLSAITEKMQQAQYEALRLVNKSLLTLYWEIGKSITHTGGVSPL